MRIPPYRWDDYRWSDTRPGWTWDLRGTEIIGQHRTNKLWRRNRAKVLAGGLLFIGTIAFVAIAAVTAIR